MLPDEVVVVAVTEPSVVVVVTSTEVVVAVTPINTIIARRSIAQSNSLSPDVVLLVLVGSAVPDPEQASCPLRDRPTMSG